MAQAPIIRYKSPVNSALQALETMKIDLRNNQFDCGAYGLVVFIKNRSKAVKIFKRTHTEEQANNVFNSEVEAYEKVSSDPKALEITPKYFGKETIEQVIDKDGSDVTNDYYTELAYVMSYEEGPFYKLNSIDEIQKEKIKNILQPLGILYLIDCSVSLNEHREVKYVIDFGIAEYEVWA